MQEGLKALEILLDPYEWLYEVVAEPQVRRYVVYVHTMDKSQDAIIPDRMMGYQVVIHFASSAPGVQNEFVNRSQIHMLPVYSPFDRIPEVLNIDILTDGLDRLEKICGANILGDIFFEIKDGHNAVTNLSAKYPEVRHSLEKLYTKYGFNIIYDELEL